MGKINLENGLYILESEADGSRKCLIFSANGKNQYPERYNWGASESLCGIPTSLGSEHVLRVAVVVAVALEALAQASARVARAAVRALRDVVVRGAGRGLRDERGRLRDAVDALDRVQGRGLASDVAASTGDVGLGAVRRLGRRYDGGGIRHSADHVGDEVSLHEAADHDARAVVEVDLGAAGHRRTGRRVCRDARGTHLAELPM